MKKTLKILGIFLLLVIGYFVMGMYTPVQYEAPHMTPRESTKYWQLSTGSHIAYTHLTSCDDMGAYPVIYLHGGPGGYVYSENIKVLKPLTELGFDVYLYDQIGSGLSKSRWQYPYGLAKERSAERPPFASRHRWALYITSHGQPMFFLNLAGQGAKGTAIDYMYTQ